MAVQRFKWTRESAIQYLASNPDFSSKKPLDQWSTSELKRRASVFKRAEQEQRPAPTKEEQRGHARAKVEHLQRDPDKHILDQYRVRKPPSRDIDKADLDNLYKRAKKGKKPRDEVLVVITGVSEGSPRFKEHYQKGEIHTYTYSMNMQSLKGFIDDMTDIYQFAEEVSFLKWDEVLAVSFAFPNPKE